MSGNYAIGGAGILNNPEGGLAVLDCLLTGNSGVFGGGIYNGGRLTVSGSTLSNNTASRSGGGLANFGTATLQGCSLSGNSAGSAGGGVSNFGTLAIKDSTVLGNSAPLGADLYDRGLTTLANSAVGVIDS